MNITNTSLGLQLCRVGSNIELYSIKKMPYKPFQSIKTFENDEEVTLFIKENIGSKDLEISWMCAGLSVLLHLKTAKTEKGMDSGHFNH